ncbi:MAG: hypothetical protein AB8A35_08005, partial [Prochlorococcus sp.]
LLGTLLQPKHPITNQARFLEAGSSSQRALSREMLNGFAGVLLVMAFAVHDGLGLGVRWICLNSIN